MKKILAGVMVLLFAAPGFAAESVKVSGAVELHYLSSSDYYGDTGGDTMQAEELYVQFDKTVSKNIDMRLKLDGADTQDKSDEGAVLVKDADPNKYVEEATITFKKAGDKNLSITVGKAEMPFGQDYEKFLFSSVTHGLEIDKVWGLQADYKLDKKSSIALGLFEYDATTDVSMTSNMALQYKIKLSNKLTAEASYATLGDDGAVGAEAETRINAGFVFKANKKLKIHGEYTDIANVGNADGADNTVILVGADYKHKKYLIKARYETVDDGSQDTQIAVGVDYNFDKNTVVAIELEKKAYEVSALDTDAILIGVKTKF